MIKCLKISYKVNLQKITKKKFAFFFAFLTSKPVIFYVLNTWDNLNSYF